MLASIILQLGAGATVDLQIAIEISGPAVGSLNSILLRDSHTWCQNTLRHYILSQMVMQLPAPAPLRQSHICVPMPRLNLVSSFLRKARSERGHKQTFWCWVWSWHTVLLHIKKTFANPAVNLWISIFFLESFTGCLCNYGNLCVRCSLSTGRQGCTAFKCRSTASSFLLTSLQKWLSFVYFNLIHTRIYIWIKGSEYIQFKI